METKTIQKSESFISNTFDKQSKGFNKRDSNGLSKTASEHVKQITSDSSVKIALDVGSGTGGILEGLLENNLDFAYGVDLSPKMIELAKKRIEEKGFGSKTKIENISFLEYSFEKNLDAVSLHRVLCCHPDREAMLTKAISANPKLIVITIPRTRFFMKFVMGIVSGLRKIKPGFRPYLHNIKLIDKQLQYAGYELVDSFKTRIWITRTYKSKV